MVTQEDDMTRAEILRLVNQYDEMAIKTKQCQIRLMFEEDLSTLNTFYVPKNPCTMRISIKKSPPIMDGDLLILTLIPTPS